MNNDISSQYTKDRNKNTGRHGYVLWKNEKETIIKPSDYGMFLQKSKVSK